MGFKRVFSPSTHSKISSFFDQHPDINFMDTDEFNDNFSDLDDEFN